MRICMCLGKYYPVVGGSGRSAFILNQELARRGVEVFVVAHRYKGLKKTEKISPNHSVYRVEAFPEVYSLQMNFASLSLSLFRMAIKLIKKYHISIFHSHEISYGGTAGLILKYVNNVSTVLKYGGDFVFEYLSKANKKWDPRKGVLASWNEKCLGARLSFSLQKKYFSKYDHIYANSTYGYNILRKLKIPREKLSLIENGVLLSEFHRMRSQLRSYYKIDGNLLFTGGRFVRWKGFDIAIKALDLVLKKYPNTYLVLGGQGEEDNRLRKLARKYCPNHVIFAGPIPFERMPEYYSASDVFLHPSYYDVGMPNMILEALACEVPTVCSNIDAAKCVIQDERTGLLFKPGDHRSLADKIIFCLANSSRVRAMTKAGRRLVESRFDHRIMVNSILKLYETLN